MGLADAGLRRAGFTDPTLVLRWPAIVGADVARVAEPVKYQEGPNGAVLTLKCEPAASVFLQHETRALIDKVNAYLGRGRVARIRLVSGTLARTPSLPDHPHPKMERGEASKSLPDTLRRFSELRRRLKK